MSKYSIIIPTLNEEQNLEKVLSNLKEINEDIEIIVTDGGSTDKTVEIARKFGASLCISIRGRGQQQNAGAECSSGEILIFLHADTILPASAFRLIEKYFKKKDNKIATFRLGFDIENPILKFYTLFTWFDSRFTTFGDQAIVIRRDFFFNIGKFPNQSIFEDVALLANARKKTKLYKLPASVISSARRFTEKGIVQTQFVNAWYYIQYIFGVNTQRLYKKYYNMKNNKSISAVIIFVKYPEEGKVKTRLAQSRGNAFATKFYRLCSEHIFKEVKKLNRDTADSFIFYSEENDKAKIEKWVDSKFMLLPQSGNDLGEKMLNAFSTVFDSGVKNTLIIGTDVPDLSKELFEEAIRQLDNYDIVINPSADGGYNLLGMNKVYPQLFERIQWSSEEVYNETIIRCKSLGLKVKIIEELIDIDTEEDLMFWLSDPSRKSNVKLKNQINDLVKKE